METLSTFCFQDGILIAKYNKGLDIDLIKAKQLISERLAFQNGKDYPVIIYFNGMKTSSKEARMYMSTEGVKGITMGAFIVRNAVEKVIFNFFFTMEKPPIPSKAFTSEEEAIQWINEIRSSKNA